MLTVKAIVESSLFKNATPVTQEYILSIIKGAMIQQGKTLEQLLLIDNLENLRLEDLKMELEDTKEQAKTELLSAKVDYNQETMDSIIDTFNAFVDAADEGPTHVELILKASYTKERFLEILNDLS